MMIKTSFGLSFSYEAIRIARMMIIIKMVRPLDNNTLKKSEIIIFSPPLPFW